jgi:CRP/FNR family transcriptional regulator, cyclic AMP receptor protein
MKIQMLPPAQIFTQDEELLSLPTGNVLFKQGDQGSYMYVMKSGQADVIMDGHIVGKAQAGAILGEESLLDSALRAATVIAITDCKLIAINRKRLDTLIAKSPGFLHYLKNLAAGRINAMDSHSGGHVLRG